MKDFYSIEEFAAELGISKRTVYRMIKNAQINALRAGSTPLGNYRIPHTEILKLAEDQYKRRSES